MMNFKAHVSENFKEYKTVLDVESNPEAVSLIRKYFKICRRNGWHEEFGEQCVALPNIVISELGLNAFGDCMVALEKLVSMASVEQDFSKLSKEFIKLCKTEV